MRPHNKQSLKTTHTSCVNTQNFQAAIVNTNAKIDFTVLPPTLKLVPSPGHSRSTQKGDRYLCRKSDHWSFLCTEKATFKEREDVYKARGACTTCARSHAGTCTQKPRHMCNWFNCCAIDQHHTALCSVAPYPITRGKVTQWHRQLHALQKLCPTEYRPYPQTKGTSKYAKKPIRSLHTAGYVTSNRTYKHFPFTGKR